MPESLAPEKNGMEIGLLVASFSAMQFLFAPAWGRLSDRIGRRPVLMVGLAGSVVFYALFGLATVWQSMAWMFVSRIGAGIAGATITTAQAYIADTTTLETRGKGMAMIGAAFGLGFTFGPLFGGFTLFWSPNEASPWPGYAAAILSSFALALAYFKLPESRTAQSKSAGRKVFDFGAWATPCARHRSDRFCLRCLSASWPLRILKPHCRSYSLRAKWKAAHSTSRCKKSCTRSRSSG